MMYAGPVHAVEFQLSPDDWAFAAETGAARDRRNRQFRGSTATNSYWNPVERHVHGVIGEILLCRILGQDLMALRLPATFAELDRGAVS